MISNMVSLQVLLLSTLISSVAIGVPDKTQTDVFVTSKFHEDIVDIITKTVNLFSDDHLVSLFYDEGSEDVLEGIVKNLAAKSLRIFKMNNNTLSQQETWTRTSFDIYVMLLLSCKPLIKHANSSHYHTQIANYEVHPSALWNYEAQYLLVFLDQSLSSVDPTEMILLYNFNKTLRVFVIEAKLNYFVLLEKTFYKENPLNFLGKWVLGSYTFHPNVNAKKEFNFNNAQLSVATFEHPPSVFYIHDKNGDVKQRYGVDMELIKALSEAKNFSVTYHEVSHDELWGYELSNGTWVGLVGELFYERVDIGACNLFLEEHRWAQVDYTTPYNFEKGCFAVPSPKAIPRWRSPTLPYTGNMWAIMLVTFSLSVIVLFFILRLSLRKEFLDLYSLSYELLYVLGITVVRNLYLQPRFWPTRMYLVFLGFYGFIITTGYSANLIAFLTVTLLSPPINTLKELHKSHLKIGGVAFWKTQFAASIDPVIQSFEQSLLETDNLNYLLDMAAADKFALIENKQYLEFKIASLYTHQGKTSISIVQECLLPYNIGLGVQKNSPVKEVINSDVHHLFESGILQKWKEKVAVVFKQIHETHKTAKSEDANSGDDVRQITLDHLPGVFMLYAVGLLLALFAFMFEMVLGTR